jgi:hypothetical protein
MRRDWEEKMKAKKWVISEIILLLCFFVFGGLPLFSNPASCEMTSANYRIIVSVISSGGGASVSSSYNLFSTLGQPSPTGLSNSTHYSNYGGFIYTLEGVVSYPEVGTCRIGGTSYLTIQSAYDSSVSGDKIQCRDLTFNEDVRVDRNVSVTMEGGYDAGFTSNSGRKTTLKGMITTTHGKIAMSNFILSK